MLKEATVTTMDLPVHISKIPTLINFGLVGGPQDLSTHNAQLGPISTLIAHTSEDLLALNDLLSIGCIVCFYPPSSAYVYHIPSATYFNCTLVDGLWRFDLSDVLLMTAPTAVVRDADAYAIMTAHVSSIASAFTAIVSTATEPMPSASTTALLSNQSTSNVSSSPGYAISADVTSNDSAQLSNYIDDISVLVYDPPTHSQYLQCICLLRVVSQLDKDQIIYFHKRMGHPLFRRLMEAIKHGSWSNCPFSRSQIRDVLAEYNCTICQLTRRNRITRPISTGVKSSRPGLHISMDRLG